MDTFDQMFEIVTAFNDDKFQSVLKEAGEARKDLVKKKKAHNEREAALVKKEKEADVVLNSQKTFSGQHEAAMAKVQKEKQELQLRKDALEAERTAFDDKAKAEEDRLKQWTVDLGQKQHEVDAVLETREQTAKTHKKALAMKAEWAGKLAKFKELV